MLDRNAYKIYSLGSYAPTVSGKEGSYPGVGGAIFPNFFSRYFAFGVLAQSQVMSEASGDDIRYRSKYQFIPTFGTGIRLASGIVRFGYSFQWVNQASGDVTAPLESGIGYNKSLEQGSALSHNLGAALTFPVRYLPSLNVVARNVMGAKYTEMKFFKIVNESTGLPADEEMTIDASFSFQPKLGRGSYMNFVLQDRDVTNRSGVPIHGRLAVGAEFSYRDQFFLRGGWSGGYPSAGIGLKRRQAEFSFAWHSEEIGTGYKDQRDSRFLVHYQIRVF